MKGPLPYVGGKTLLADRIIERIPPHHTYIEVFAGGLQVFFRKPPSKAEVVNDLDDDLVCFYRVLQNHLEEFYKQFKWLCISRKTFDDFKQDIEGSSLTDIQRAARYYYLQRQSFGGTVRSRSFGVSHDARPKINLLRIEEELTDHHMRLAGGVIIEHLDWKELVRRYDHENNFFFLDPPYFCNPTYKHNFEGIEDFQKMAHILSNLRGRWLLTVNDHPQLCDVFKDFLIEKVGLKYSVSAKESQDVSELIITNYEPKKYQPELFE